MGQTKIISANRKSFFLFVYLDKEQDAVNDLEKSILFGEVKRKKENISIAGLKDKAKNLEAQLKDYHAKFIGLSIEDM